MCGIAEIRETFTESKIGNRKNTKLGTAIQENEKQIHYTQTAIGLFFFFFPHLIFFRSGSAFIILLPVYRTIALPRFEALQSATSQWHIGRLLFLLPFPPTSPIYKNAIVIYHQRKKRGGKSWQLSLGLGNRDLRRHYGFNWKSH